MIKFVELNISWPTRSIFIILNFHSTNELMPNQFVQDKFVQEFVTILSLKKKQDLVGNGTSDVKLKESFKEIMG